MLCRQQVPTGLDGRSYECGNETPSPPAEDRQRWMARFSITWWQSVRQTWMGSREASSWSTSSPGWTFRRPEWSQEAGVDFHMAIAGSPRPPVTQPGRLGVGYHHSPGSALRRGRGNLQQKENAVGCRTSEGPIFLGTMYIPKEVTREYVNGGWIAEPFPWVRI